MFALLQAQIAEIERKLAHLLLPATVHERDHTKGVRFKVAEDDAGNPVLSAWVQPPDNNKGTRSRWLPQVGSQHLLMTPAGVDGAMSFVPLSHHEASPNPASDADDTVIYDDGECRIAAKGGVITIRSGGSSVTIRDGKIELSSDLIQATGGELKHNNKSVGDEHVHTGVVPGGGLSSVPA